MAKHGGRRRKVGRKGGSKKAMRHLRRGRKGAGRRGKSGIAHLLHRSSGRGSRKHPRA